MHSDSEPYSTKRSVYLTPKIFSTIKRCTRNVV